MSDVTFQIRPAVAADVPQLAPMRKTLYREASPEEHLADVTAILAGDPASTMPLTLIVATEGGELVGFAEVGLRSHADGCDPVRPVGFLEGWYVVDARRESGVGRALLAAAEDWCREHGAREIASDTWIDNERSQRAHEAVGFEVVDRCITYRKPLPPGPPSFQRGNQGAAGHLALVGRLADGNERFVSGRPENTCSTDPGAKLAQLAAGQKPFAAILGCADSRIPVEQVFDQGIGSLFVVRVAGHVVEQVVVESLEFAVGQLGVQLIVVLAHTGCGAVSLTVDALQGRVSAYDSALVAGIRRGLRPGPLTVDEAVEQHLAGSVERICNARSLFSERLKAGTLSVVPALFHTPTGRVSF